jgi:hypothetical protein
MSRLAIFCCAIERRTKLSRDAEILGLEILPLTPV